MSSSFSNPARQIVPRWRSSAVTSKLGELDSVEAPKRRIAPRPGELEELQLAWMTHGSAAFAADLVGAAFLHGRPELAHDAAAFLLGAEGNEGSPVYSVARALIGEAPAGDWAADLPTDKHRGLISNFRRRLIDEPNNPFMWVDLALQYTILGQSRASERAILAALTLAPNDRFVLRSASRYYLHRGQPDRAHDLLRRSPRTQEDPWLLASEFALGKLAGKAPKFVKKGRSLVASLPPSHTAELAAALGTLELTNGSTRAAKGHFKESLRKPNENALAQVTWWADANHLTFDLAGSSTVPLSFEADTWTYFHDGNWSASIEAANRWLTDEPFSRRAAMFGSFITAVIADNYAESVRFAQAGLQSHPADPVLLNNLAFAQASGGNVGAAKEALAQMSHNSRDKKLTAEESIMFLATTGCVAFKEKQFDKGRDHYRAAVAIAKGPDFENYRISARIHHAREEAAVDPAEARGLLASAEAELRSLSGAEADAWRHLLARVKEAVKLAAEKVPART